MQYCSSNPTVWQSNKIVYYSSDSRNQNPWKLKTSDSMTAIKLPAWTSPDMKPQYNSFKFPRSLAGNSSCSESFEVTMMISGNSETRSRALRVAAEGHSNVNVAKRRERHLRSILITACREKLLDWILMSGPRSSSWTFRTTCSWNIVSKMWKCR